MSGPWIGDGQYRLAPALLTLLQQLRVAYPGQGWLNSPQTGTIGDRNHLAKGWANSDHNPWLDGTVRALDVAVNVSGVAGIVDVSDGPPGKSLAAMVNAMFAAKDPRVWPNGYVIFDGEETDWDNPGGMHPYTGADQHHYHAHISCSQNPDGFNSTDPWPLIPPAQPTGARAHKITAARGGRMFRIIRNVENGALRACGPGFWAAIQGKTSKDTLAILAVVRADPLCIDPAVEDVSPARMQLLHDIFTKGSTL